MCLSRRRTPDTVWNQTKSIMKQTLMNFKSIACFKVPVQGKQRDSRMDFSLR